MKDQQTGKSVRPAEDLAKNAVDFAQLTKDHPHYDEYWKANAPDFRNIKVPFYTVTNFSGHPVSTNSHFRLMHEAQTPKDKKWLELISGKHVKPMYDPENVLSQRRFLDHILKGVDNGWDKVKPTLHFFFASLTIPGSAYKIYNKRKIRFYILSV